MWVLSYDPYFSSASQDQPVPEEESEYVAESNNEQTSFKSTTNQEELIIFDSQDVIGKLLRAYKIKTVSEYREIDRKKAVLQGKGVKGFALLRELHFKLIDLVNENKQSKLVKWKQAEQTPK